MLAYGNRLTAGIGTDFTLHVNENQPTSKSVLPPTENAEENLGKLEVDVNFYWDSNYW